MKVSDEPIQKRNTEVSEIAGRAAQFPEWRNSVILSRYRLQDVAGIPTQWLPSDFEVRIEYSIGEQIISVEEETFLDGGRSCLPKSKVDQTFLHAHFSPIAECSILSSNS